MNTTDDLSPETLLTTAMTTVPARGILLAAAVLVAGLQAGTYFTWSTGVMPGLARVDDRTFVEAMQQINLAIVNPLFLATFLGAPALAGAAALLEVRPYDRGRSRARSWPSARWRSPSPATSRSTMPWPQRARSTRSRTWLRSARTSRPAGSCSTPAATVTSAGALACLAMAALRTRG